jgi:hypothetical protein
VFRVVVDPARKASSTGLPASVPALSAFLGPNVPEPPAFLGGEPPGPSGNPAMIVFTDTGAPRKLPAPAPQFFLGSAQNPWQRFNDTVVFVPSDSAGTPLPMVLDSTQSWKVVNNSVVGINHPFHIHINPFQVDSVHAPAGTSDPFYALFQELNAASRRGSPIWLDVIPLPSPSQNGNGVIVDSAGSPVDPGYVFITQRYDELHGVRRRQLRPGHRAVRDALPHPGPRRAGDDAGAAAEPVRHGRRPRGIRRGRRGGAPAIGDGPRAPLTSSADGDGGRRPARGRSLPGRLSLPRPRPADGFYRSVHARERSGREVLSITPLTPCGTGLSSSSEKQTPSRSM